MQGTTGTGFGAAVATYTRVGATSGTGSTLFGAAVATSTRIGATSGTGSTLFGAAGQFKHWIKHPELNYIISLTSVLHMENIFWTLCLFYL